MLGDRSLLCIDWDEGSLRVLDVALSRAGVKVRQAVQVRLPAEVGAHDPAAMGAFLRRTLAEHRIRTRRAVVDIPRQDAFLNLMSLPNGSIEELASMVHVQAAKELPFARDQAVIDFTVAGDPGKAAMADVWVAAVRNAVVDRYRQAIAAAGLKLERIGLRPMANAAGLSAELAGGQRVLVDIGPLMSEINVIIQGRLAYSRAASVNIPIVGLGEKAQKREEAPAEASAEDTIPLVGDDIPRVEPLDVLLIEVSRTIEAYRATAPGVVIDGIIVAGTVGIGQEVVQRIERRFGVETKVYEAPESVQWRRGKTVSEAAPFSAVLGLAMTEASEPLARFDFLHPKEPEAVERVRKRRRPLVVATVLMFVAAGVVAAYTPLHRKKTEIEGLKQTRAELQNDSKVRQQMIKQLADVRGWQKRDFVWIDKLRVLFEAFPPNKECYITQLECTDKGRITVTLMAKDEKVATSIVETVSTLKGANGKPLFTANPGEAQPAEKSTGAKPAAGQQTAYPVKDQVIIQLEAAAS